MRRFLAFLGLLLAVADGGGPAHAYPPGQRAPILTPGTCANVIARLDFAANDGGGSYCLNGTRYPNFASIPGASFTRAGPETCSWADGHLTYAASGVPCTTDLGLGAWESRTNLVAWSQAFFGHASTMATSVTDNAFIAPDGAATAAKLAEDATNASHYMFEGGGSVSSGIAYTVSAYFHAAERASAAMWLLNSSTADRGAAQLTFAGSGSGSCVAAAQGGTPFTSVNCTIVNVGNG